MMILKIFIISFFFVTWGSVPLLVKGELNCSINNLTHNYLTITDPVYDSDLLTTLPYTYKLSTQKVTGVGIVSDEERSVVSVKLDNNNQNYNDKIVVLSANQIKEETRTSKYFPYLYNFTIRLTCEDKSIVNMYTTFQIVDTNNHEPFFEKPTYTYNLFSPHMEDFYRLQTLNPITGTDYDLTNNELIFSISQNNYFDIKYNGIVPGTNNKKHYAQIVPKVPGASITNKVVVDITVTDVGYPSSKNTATLVINPPSPPLPTFLKPFYIGHLFYNRSFWMEENPKLEGGTTYYVTNAVILGADYSKTYSYTISVKNNEFVIQYSPYYLSDLDFFKNKYLVYVLTATYTDTVTSLKTSGNTTFIVQHHHETFTDAVFPSSSTTENWYT